MITITFCQFFGTNRKACLCTLRNPLSFYNNIRISCSFEVTTNTTWLCFRRKLYCFTGLVQVWHLNLIVRALHNLPSTLIEKHLRDLVWFRIKPWQVSYLKTDKKNWWLCLTFIRAPCRSVSWKVTNLSWLTHMVTDYDVTSILCWGLLWTLVMNSSIEIQQDVSIVGSNFF